MQGFTYIDLIILVVYLAAVLFAGLHFAKKEMKGKSILKVTEPCVVGYFRIYFRNFIKPDFIPVTGRKLICRNMDHVVCTARYAACNPDYDLNFSCRSTVNWTLIQLIIIWN